MLQLYEGDQRANWLPSLVIHFLFRKAYRILVFVGYFPPHLHLLSSFIKIQEGHTLISCIATFMVRLPLQCEDIVSSVCGSAVDTEEEVKLISTSFHWLLTRLL